MSRYDSSVQRTYLRTASSPSNQEKLRQSTNRLLAEGVGTFWVVFADCGAAVLGATFPQLGIGVFGISFAFGLTG